MIDKLKKGDKFCVYQGNNKTNGIFEFLNKKQGAIIAKKDGKVIVIPVRVTTRVEKYVPKSNLQVWML